MHTLRRKTLVPVPVASDNRVSSGRSGCREQLVASTASRSARCNAKRACVHTAKAGALTSFATLSVAVILYLLMVSTAHAQQFSGDNQWVAPHGVATIVGTVGEEYSQFYAVAALIPEWEFNLQLTHYYDDPRDNNDAYTATSLYVKHRLAQNDRETSGYAFLAGTGLFPEHLQQGEVSRAFQSWWATGVATYAFADDTILWDILPGVAVNFDQDQTGETAWGFTYTSRLAVYEVIPQSAIVAEVFGAAGEAYAEPSYRFGVRWESPKWIWALTYANSFDGSGGAGVELGVMYFTDPRFCIGGCKRK